TSLLRGNEPDVPYNASPVEAHAQAVDVPACLLVREPRFEERHGERPFCRARIEVFEGAPARLRLGAVRRAKPSEDGCLGETRDDRGGIVRADGASQDDPRARTPRGGHDERSENEAPHSHRSRRPSASRYATATTRPLRSNRTATRFSRSQPRSNASLRF